MAGPISHIVYAEKALQQFITDKDERQFIVGTLLPDIRYLKVIDREVTHFTGVSLADVQAEPDSFKAGVLFHSLIDEAREAFVKDHHVYISLPQSHLSSVALKTCEDIRLHPVSANWPVYKDYLQTITDQELAYPIPANELKRWHDINSTIFASPTLDRYISLSASLGFSDQQTTEVLNLVEIISNNNIIDSYLPELYENLEQVLRQRHTLLQ